MCWIPQPGNTSSIYPCLAHVFCLVTSFIFKFILIRSPIHVIIRCYMMYDLLYHKSSTSSVNNTILHTIKIHSLDVTFVFTNFSWHCAEELSRPEWNSAVYGNEWTTHVQVISTACKHKFNNPHLICITWKPMFLFSNRYYAGWADKNHGKTIPVGKACMCVTIFVVQTTSNSITSTLKTRTMQCHLDKPLEIWNE